VLAYQPVSSNKIYLLICTAIVTFSALMALLQAFVPDRAMSGLDLLANIAGVFLAALLMYWLYGSKNQEAWAGRAEKGAMNAVMHAL
jgi:VanZ family protein